MDPFGKKSKKKARKAGAEAKPAVQTNIDPPAEKYTSSWEEEQLVDYETEEPARFFPVEEDIFSGEDDYPPHGDGPADNIPITNNFPAYLAEGADMAGRKRSQILLKRGSTAARPAGASASAAPYKRVLNPQVIKSGWIWRGKVDPEARLLPYQ